VEETREQIIAVCGLDCILCPLRRASLGDIEAAQDLAGWWKKEGWLKEGEGVSEVLERGPHCQHCRGDRSVHWSPECWILKCCVDEKEIEFCYECDDFPCEQLSEWAKKETIYTEALNRLRSMREGGTV
jgi:hypothetical protein